MRLTGSLPLLSAVLFASLTTVAAHAAPPVPSPHAPHAPAVAVPHEAAPQKLPTAIHLTPAPARPQQSGGLLNRLKHMLKTAVNPSAAKYGPTVSWDVAQGRFSELAVASVSGSPERLSAAIDQVADTRVAVSSLKGLEPRVYNGTFGDAAERLTGLVLRAPDSKTQLQAMNALVKFSNANTEGYRKGFLVRVAVENLSRIYRDPSLGDDIRMLAHVELRKVEWRPIGKFQSSAELRSAAPPPPS